MGIKVRAIATGYYGSIVRTAGGPEFEINDKSEFSANWMEYADSSEKPAESKNKASKKAKTSDQRQQEIEKIKAAMIDLDPEKDENWDEDHPNVDVLSKIVGFEVSESDLKQAYPNWTRSEARASAAKI